MLRKKKMEALQSSSFQMVDLPSEWSVQSRPYLVHRHAGPLTSGNSFIVISRSCALPVHFQPHHSLSDLYCAQSLSHVRLFLTPRAVARPAPLSMGILQARILEWVSMPSSRGFSNPGIKPRSPTLQMDSLPSEPPGKPPWCKVLRWRWRDAKS